MAASALGVRILSGVACVCIASAQQQQQRRPARCEAAASAAAAGDARAPHHNGGVAACAAAANSVHHGLVGPGSAGAGAGAAGRKPRMRRCVASTASRRSVDGVSYEVYPVAGDGRCLFRSVAAAVALETGSTSDGTRLSDAEESAEADRLRAAAVDELVKRRTDVEWFIEGDFERYCRAMRVPSAWGGEPEILMLTHVLRAPIEVFMSAEERSTKALGRGGLGGGGGGTLRSIAHYGRDEYGDAATDGGGGGGIAVLFHGAGHYEALSKCE